MSEDTGGMKVDPGLVRQLAELLDANHLTEIEVQDGERRIRVARKAASNGAPAAPAAPIYAPIPVAPSPEIAATPLDDPSTHPGVLRSPMVGTAYLSAEPGSPPFFAEGTQVKAGDTLLIVEAMKVMNPIAAPRTGTLRRMLVVDGQPIEFDQPLAIID